MLGNMLDISANTIVPDNCNVSQLVIPSNLAADHIRIRVHEAIFCCLIQNFQAQRIGSES